MMNAVFVTSNENKFKEFQRILGGDISRINLELEELQEMDLELIVEHKAKQAYAMMKMPVIVEDAGLFLDAWGGFPGPFTKWFDETAGYASLPTFVPKNNRGVEWVVLYGYYDGVIFETFKGNLRGIVVTKPKGEGWGFGKYIMPDGHEETLGELGDDVCDKIGARGKAIKKLKKFLTEE